MCDTEPSALIELERSKRSASGSTHPLPTVNYAKSLRARVIRVGRRSTPPSPRRPSRVYRQEGEAEEVNDGEKKATVSLPPP
jgi:hypothetical protein